MALEVSFVRHRGRRDRVYVSRADGSSTGWDFPSYGDRLPHDLCHLVVEEGLGIVEGFWGLVERGVEVELIDNQATLVRDGKPLVEKVGTDFTDLVAAAEAVALCSSIGVETEEVGSVTVVRLDASASGSSGSGPAPGADIEGLGADTGFGFPAGTPPAAVVAVRQRLAELSERWRALGDGEAIVLSYRGR